jgi:hypothetical protein
MGQRPIVIGFELSLLVLLCVQFFSKNVIIIVYFSRFRASEYDRALNCPGFGMEVLRSVYFVHARRYTNTDASKFMLSCI